MTFVPITYQAGIDATALVETLVYCRKNSSWLLLHRVQPPLVWSTVTGGVKGAEVYPRAALRELHEETGLKPDEFYNADFSTRFYRHEENVLYEVFTFLAVMDALPQIELDSEHDRFEWVSLEEACARIPFAKQREGLAHAAREFIQSEPPEILRIDPERFYWSSFSIGVAEEAKQNEASTIRRRRGGSWLGQLLRGFR